MGQEDNDVGGERFDDLLKFIEAAWDTAGEIACSLNMSELLFECLRDTGRQIPFAGWHQLQHWIKGL